MNQLTNRSCVHFFNSLHSSPKQWLSHRSLFRVPSFGFLSDELYPYPWLLALLSSQRCNRCRIVVSLRRNVAAFGRCGAF